MIYLRRWPYIGSPSAVSIDEWHEVFEVTRKLRKLPPDMDPRLLLHLPRQPAAVNPGRMRLLH
jgi:hypothetical protein